MAAPVPADDLVGQKAEAYLNDIFAKLKLAADKQPDAQTFREAMKPVVVWQRTHTALVLKS